MSAHDVNSGLPSALPRPPDELPKLKAAWRTPRGLRFLTSVNNTSIGLLYIGTALLFFLLAGILALLMRAQLAVPENTLLSPNAYNQVFTMHGTVMMFLFAIPIVEAVAVYLLPNMLGARDLPFPRLSAYAYWAYAIGGLAFFCTLFWGLAPDGGWFMYPPLTGKVYSPGLNADFWLLGIGFIEISAIAGAIELIVGILFTRAPGMTLWRMPVYAWSMLVVAFMIVFAFPAIIAGTALLELERAFDWPFFIAERGGDPVLWQHLFWFFGHPEVYIIFLPAAGMVSTMIPTIAQTPLVGRRAVIGALVATGFFSFALWAHHMFTAGLGLMTMSFVSAASMAVAVPTAVQVFAWIATLWRGTVTRRMRAGGPTLFLCGFMFIFVLGGLTGVMVALLPFDWQVHDTYFVVAHLHYVLVGGLVFPVFAALYYWLPLIKGTRMSERLARWIFGCMFAGFNIAFFPMHLTGLLGMPRRVYTYAPDLGWNALNLVSTFGAFLFALGVALCLFDLVRTLRRPEQPVGNPWNASTLEWLPNEDYATRSIPQVTSTDPLWDQPDLAGQVERGEHWLPGTATGLRETIVTSPLKAMPRYLFVIPTDSWWPLIGAIGTAGFFLLLTVKLTWLAWACGIAAIGAVWIWLWQSDRPASLARARVADNAADGGELPVNLPGAWSPSWWATVIMLVVDATIFASFVFAYVHISMRMTDGCPPPGTRLPTPGWPLASGALQLAGTAAMLFAAKRARRAAPQGALRLAVFAGFACMAGGFGVDWYGLADAGLAPTTQAWSAAIGAMLAYQGLHLVALAFVAAFVWLRSHAGHLGPANRATMDNSVMIWGYTALQGIVMSLAVHGVPLLME